MGKKQKIKFAKPFLIKVLIYFVFTFCISLFISFWIFGFTAEVTKVLATALFLAVMVIPLVLMMSFAIVLLSLSEILAIYVKLFNKTQDIVDQDFIQAQSEDLVELGFHKIEEHPSIRSVAIYDKKSSTKPIKAVFHKGSSISGFETYALLFEDFTIIRNQKNNSSLPTFIINSLINDSSHGSINTDRISGQTLDLGSDFGKYIKLTTLRDNQIEVLQIVEPSFMMSWLSKGMLFDAYVSSTSGNAFVDFKFAYENLQKRNLRFVIENSDYLSLRIFNKTSNAKNSIAKQIFDIKDQSTPVLKMLDVFVINLFKSAVILIALIFTIAAIPEATPFIIKVIVSILFIAFFVIVAIRLLLILNIFSMFVVSSSITKILITSRVAKLSKNYQYVMTKYSN